MENLIGLKVVTSIRPETGITGEMQGDYVLITYPTLGFSELVHTKLVKITIIK
jgi:hypothetical protein